MVSKMVLLTRAAGMLDAESLRLLLESFNIPAELVQESAGRTYGLTAGPLGEVEVLVPAELFADAQSILDALNRGELENPDYPLKPPDQGL